MKGSRSIYPQNGRALIYRLADRYEFQVSGTGLFPDFIYKVVHAPLDSNALALGQLAVQSVMGYRKISEEEFQKYQKELNRQHPDEEQLVEQGKLPNVCVWPEEKATEVSAQVNLEMVEKFMIPLDASAQEIGRAILKGFAAIDAHIAQAAPTPAKHKTILVPSPAKARGVPKRK